MPWRRPGRVWRHIVTDTTDARRAVPRAAMDRLQKVIAEGEARHRGQVCVAIEGSLPLPSVFRNVTPRERALEVFGLMRVWDTEENAGVLVYLLLADHDVEIVADRGISRKVADETWQRICEAMEAAFRERRFAEGLEAGIRAINEQLARHFPRDGAGPNELPDRPQIV